MKCTGSAECVTGKLKHKGIFTALESILKRDPFSLLEKKKKLINFRFGLERVLFEILI